MHDPDFNLSDRDFGNPVRLRLFSKTKEKKNISGAALVIDAKLIGSGPTKQGNARQKRYAQAGNLYWIFG